MAIATITAVHSCHDAKCSGGITDCTGCRGFGMVNPKGKPYRKQENIPSWAVEHAACHGKGMVVCAERNLKSEPLVEAELLTLGMPVPPVPVPVRKPRTRKPAAAKVA